MVPHDFAFQDTESIIFLGGLSPAVSEGTKRGEQGTVCIRTLNACQMRRAHALLNIQHTSLAIYSPKEAALVAFERIYSVISISSNKVWASWLHFKCIADRNHVSVFDFVTANAWSCTRNLQYWPGHLFSSGRAFVSSPHQSRFLARMEVSSEPASAPKQLNRYACYTHNDNRSGFDSAHHRYSQYSFSSNSDKSWKYSAAFDQMSDSFLIFEIKDSWCYWIRPRHFGTALDGNIQCVCVARLPFYRKII